MVFRMLHDLARTRMLKLRELIFNSGSELGLENTQIEETLKWGEPSYLSPKGQQLEWDGMKKIPISINCFSTARRH